MVTSQVGPRGLEAGDLPDRPSPAWKTVWATYTTVFIPLSSSLYSSKALNFFLWLKQMKELEQEKDTLLAGLEVLDQAREWIQDQIQLVTERQRHMGQSNHCMDFISEPSHSRLNILLPKLQLVNHCLSDLLSCSGMEVREKSDMITQLQQDKSALIKKLFDQHARSTQDDSTLDSTFI
ncbi:suppressor APC domain-containing protein 2-like isoform X2 [Anguilla rostrata]|uniref:Uncharacterized protein n=1 Tax=Anguilla anguilla TaxID=7936 RepID=A0A9D3M1Q0_ANGAN|nr:suppressor APC domain-containing protein 2-like isoform X1 [Anguilla anguilla]KAG5840965.1 hypothetical protein ANANG_G00194530 [Anguilla anguilla]